MMSEFKKLLMKRAKEGKFLSEGDKAAKMEVLDVIKEIMGGAMGEDLKGLKGMKKVTVASPTEEGLVQGLEVAQGKVEEESKDESEDEVPEMSKEEKIKKLEAELALLKGESEQAMA